MDLKQFIAELKGRGVYRVTAIYCAGAWALLQVADVMLPVLGLYASTRDGEHLQAAEKACHRALTLDRRSASVYIALGNLYRTSGQYAQAIDEFNLALSRKP